MRGGAKKAFLAENMGYHSITFCKPGRLEAMIALHTETGNAPQHTQADTTPSLADLSDQLLGFVRHAADLGRPVHEVERGSFDRIL